MNKKNLYAEHDDFNCPSCGEGHTIILVNKREEYLQNPNSADHRLVWMFKYTCLNCLFEIHSLDIKMTQELIEEIYKNECEQREAKDLQRQIVYHNHGVASFGNRQRDIALNRGFNQL